MTAGASEAATRLADLARSTATLCGRDDLVARIGEVAERIEDPTTRILVVGEFKAGKSSLVNALVGHHVCPTDTDMATAVATAVRAAPTAQASVAVRRADGTIDAIETDTGALSSWVTEHGSARAAALAAGDDVLVAEVGVPTDALGDQVIVIDLPGAGGIRSLAGAVTLSAATHVHGAVFCSDGGRPLTSDERAVLAELARRCPRVVLVESRADLHPGWRDVLRHDAAAIGGDVDACLALSAELFAAEGIDRGGGMAELRAWLDTVSTQARLREGARLAAFVEDAAREMRTALEDERVAFDDDGSAALEARQAEYQRLRAVSGRWSQLLSDNFADLSADADHQLRERLREIVRRGEERLAGVDPARGWNELVPLYRREIHEAVAAHLEMLDQRIDDVARRLAELLGTDEENAAHVHAQFVAAIGSGERSEVDERDVHVGELPRSGIGTKSLTLLRSSYSSTLMLGFLGSVIGFTVAAPAMLTVGAVLGTKGLLQENTRQRDQRRQLAGSALRRHADDVTTALGKESRDRIRRAQRALRDAMSAEVETWLRGAAEALTVAERILSASASERAERRAAIEIDLRRATTLLDAARQVRAFLTQEAT